MGSEYREEEAGVPRRGQAFGALKTSGKHRELLPRLPPGLPVPCPKLQVNAPGSGFQGRKPRLWRSRSGCPLTFSGSCSPRSGRVCLHLNVLRVRPQSAKPSPTRWCTGYSLHLVLTPHQLRPREAPWWVGGSVGAASVSASTCPCQPHRKAGVEGMEGELCPGTGMSWERQPDRGPEARTRLCSEQVWRPSRSEHNSSLTETPLSSRPLGRLESLVAR